MIKGHKLGNHYRIGLNVPHEWMNVLNDMSVSSGIPVSTLVRALIGKILKQPRQSLLDELLTTNPLDAREKVDQVDHCCHNLKNR
jgi:hypothetical protein